MRTTNHDKPRLRETLNKGELNVLKGKLRRAQVRIRRLEDRLRKEKLPPLGAIELDLLRTIAEVYINEAFEITFAEVLSLSKPQMDYYLQRLVDHQYVEVLFIDHAFGPNYAITQRGLEVLARNRLL